ncbi:MAG: DegT/DnrJ/EryC1/StrS family aminotransferase [Roseivirga sp.]|uniref:DegT/DnrJ/EryC1/StrS family aminotransferase n=1 Tax=Roseivirga sp. TaxID=1964215 RepID=UPI001B017554|nr:DegT/DnrJ/EryC1/StrS family aminotransferase [Roseivirga sp.]MBO6660992.1 DegT/DnrJ/EryC1/StrS family aminotransferase [Roseivirga sp.]MBO6761086.1 DegT/DnrJ/EryC1/StrS family aminotransferase [Roseivirga sp.]MBO6909024.1 DegT/DnrJ/EryC1/StrS family aminotransferase [Roseivirga sp.]
MTKIQMVDLIGQYNNIKEEVKDELDKVLDTAAFINGPVVKEFQSGLENFLEVRNVIPCANGTDALQIIMMAYDFPKGAEVLVPSFTYVATVEVIALLGFKPVFVEVYPDTFNIDIEDLESKITDKSVAIVPVHLYGQCADMDRLMEVAKKNHLKVFEDTAQAIGAEYTSSDGSISKAGTIGDAGATSFFPSKNLGAYGDGGAIMTNDDQLAAKLRMIVNHGQSKRYYHDSIGVNSRLDSMQAAVLKVKLKYLDGYNKARYQVASRYSEAFGKNDWITPPYESEFSSHVYHQYTIKLADDIDRQGLIDHLSERGVPSMIYYPVPNHLQKAYEYYGYKKGDLPLSEDLCSHVISLPIHTEMDKEQQEYIIDSVLSF